MSIQYIFSAKIVYLFFLVCLLNYIVSGLILFFYWGVTGTRGLFYLSEMVLASTAVAFLAIICTTVRYGMLVTWKFGNIVLSDTLSISCMISVDLLSLVCGLLVICLTIISLTFGVEYLTNEPVSHNTIVIMLAFSACIVWFIFGYDFGFMTILWELAGFFSIMLIESYYTRIRTTQAVTRTFVISRFSDYTLLLAAAECNSFCDNFQLPVIFANILNGSSENIVLLSFISDINIYSAFAATLFCAAAAKCAQFVLFVWLPDAMEAPTPASALIHSSTLVVMGVFMIIRFGPLYNSLVFVNLLLLLCGSLTVVYGALQSVQTGDLKKAVAYSTISQVGYLICGCGMLALKETLIYLIVHAVCKAMLFVFVGYTVHVFGGTTSLRKMGGVFSVIPHVALYVFVLCLILMGFPYTVGFVAKELLVVRIFNAVAPFSTFVILCWMFAIAISPLYLYRIAVLPYFGTAKASISIYRSLVNVAKKIMKFAIMSFNIKTMSNPLVFFGYEWKDLTISSRTTGLLHFIIMTAILFAGEFVFYLVLGVFNTDSLFGFSLVGEVCTNSAMSLLVNAASVSYKLQTYTVVVMLTCTVFFALNGCSFRAGYLVAGLSLLCELVVGVPYVYYLVYFIVSAIATLLTNIFLMLIITHMAKYFILIVIWWVFIEYKKSKCVLTNAKIRK